MAGWENPNWQPGNVQPPNWHNQPTGEAPDDVPDAFSFTDQFNVPTASVRTSNAITVTGLDVATDISIVDGTYSINGGAFTSDAGSVSPGDSVRVRHTSHADASTAVDTVLTIGGVSDTFTSVTADAGGTASTAPVVAIQQFRRRLLLG
jgi:hypothetical protein